MNITSCLSNENSDPAKWQQKREVVKEEKREVVKEEQLEEEYFFSRAFIESSTS